MAATFGAKPGEFPILYKTQRVKTHFVQESQAVFSTLPRRSQTDPADPCDPVTGAADVLVEALDLCEVSRGAGFG